MSQSNVFLLASKRGGRRLVFDGFMYHCAKKQTNREECNTYWVCVERNKKKSNCCAGGVLSHDEDKFVLWAHHNHAKDLDTIEVEEIKVKLKEMALSRPSERACVLLSELVGGLPSSTLAKLPKLSSLNKIVNRVRNEYLYKDCSIPIVNSLCNLQLPPVIDYFGENLLVWDSDDAEDRCLFFSTSLLLDFLNSSSLWLADGTFKVCPAIFTQLYTVHAYVNGYTIPCLYMLLPSKKKTIYEKVWGKLGNLLEENSKTPSKRMLLTDMEPGSYKAALDGIDNLHEIGICWFHKRKKKKGVRCLSALD